MQRATIIAASQFFIQSARVGTGLVRDDGNKRIETRVKHFDAREICISQFARGDSFCSNRFARLVKC